MKKYKRWPPENIKNWAKAKHIEIHDSYPACDPRRVMTLEVYFIITKERQEWNLNQLKEWMKEEIIKFLDDKEATHE